MPPRQGDRHSARHSRRAAAHKARTANAPRALRRAHSERPEPFCNGPELLLGQEAGRLEQLYADAGAVGNGDFAVDDFDAVEAVVGD